MSMDAHLLLGIDMDLSPVTHYALRSVGEFFAQVSPRLSISLLTVIPAPCMASPSPGSFRGSLRPWSPTLEQHRAAERALCSARKTLEHYGIAPECIQLLIRVGTPADEIVSAARQLEVDYIMIGSRGGSLRQRVRRWLLGSTSRRVLEHAPCPVIIVTQPQIDRCSDLVAWYEEAITRSLREHADSFTILTPRDVAFLFPPPVSNVVGRKELDAATLALEHLVSSGVLFRYDVKGEMRYVND
jgi:nucleotide-binding universal stress UspA family protein